MECGKKLVFILSKFHFDETIVWQGFGVVVVNECSAIHLGVRILFFGKDLVLSMNVSSCHDTSNFTKFE